MKEILNFINWTWRGWESWQKAIVVSFVLNISSIFVTLPWGLYMAYVGWSIIVIVVIKDIWLPMVLEKWHKYKNHRNQLLTTIKDSSQ